MRDPNTHTGMSRQAEEHALPPLAPRKTPGILRAQQESEEYREGRELLERKSVLRGLILLAALIVLVSLWRAGLTRASLAGW